MEGYEADATQPSSEVSNNGDRKRHDDEDRR
jgi:hypothetical protein